MPGLAPPIAPPPVGPLRAGPPGTPGWLGQGWPHPGFPGTASTGPLPPPPAPVPVPVPPSMAPTLPAVFAPALLANVQPWLTPSLQALALALASMFDPWLSIAADQGTDTEVGYVPGYGALLDIDLCPTAHLPWLAQFVGVQIPPGVSDVAARAFIRAEAGFQRGTLGAIAAAILRSISTPWAPQTTYQAGVLVSSGSVYYLTNQMFTTGITFDNSNLTQTDPTTQYQIQERTGPDGSANAYWFVVVVKPEQLTPPNDPSALIVAVTAAKPAGVFFSLVPTDVTLWNQAVLLWNQPTVTWNTVGVGNV